MFQSHLLITFQFVNVKANKRIQEEEEEKKAAQEKQAKMECIHVCIAMVVGHLHVYTFVFFHKNLILLFLMKISVWLAFKPELYHR